MSELVELVYNQLQKQIDRNAKNIVTATNTSEQSQYADGIPAATKVNLPTTGLANGTTYATVWFCSDGRKSGEGVGAGTGVPVYWNPATSQWYKFSDDTVVTT